MERSEHRQLNARGLTSLLERSTVALTTLGPMPGGGSQVGTGFFVAPRLVATCAHVVAVSASDLPAWVSAEHPSTGQKATLETDPELYFRQTRGLDLAVLTLAASTHPVTGPPYVLLSPDLKIGDELWTYGYPHGSFRTGQPATFRFEGWSRHSTAPDIELPRLHGTPVREGASGSPVLNLRTGAVCGMLAMSDKAGSAHLISAEQILDCSPDARGLFEAHVTAHRDWLTQLTDDQLREGRWSFPGAALRSYLAAAARASDRHPYRELILPMPESPGRRMPTLSTVYVHQSAVGDATEFSGGKSETADLAASIIFDHQEDCILVGSAGAGKSSLLRTATAESIRRWDRDTDKAVLVRVRASALLVDKPLPEAIASSVNSELANVGIDREWPADFFRRAPLPDAIWLVLVDGLDEIVDASQRQEVVDKIWGFRRSPAGQSHRFIIATRPLADIGLAFAPEWAIRAYRLLPFTDAQFKDFAVRWLTYLNVDDPDKSADELLLLLLDSGRDRLFRIPLVAMMICQLHAGDPFSPIPSTGIETYRRFIDLLSDRFFQSGIRDDLSKLAAPYGDTAMSAVNDLVVGCLTLVRALAWLHREDPEASLTIEAAKRTTSLRPVQLPHPKWIQFLQGVLRRTGLLLEEEKDFGFLHESIAEFLAAEHVASDSALSTAKFNELLPERRGNWQAAQIAWQHPFARFLVYHWSEHLDIERALQRVIRRGGIHGCIFLTTLAADGVNVGPKLTLTAVDHLQRLARPRHDLSQRRAAIDLATALNSAAGTDLLARFALSRGVPGPDRRWAVIRLATLLEPRTALKESLRANQSGTARWAYTVLAQRPGRHGIELLVRLARDSAVDATDRRWAAESLFQKDDDRAAGLLVRIAGDGHVDVEERRWAARSAQAALKVQPNRRAQARLTRLTQQAQSTQTSEAVRPLIAAHRISHPKASAPALQRAYDVAALLHAGRYRKSGDPYVAHPLAVAMILANLGMDTATLVAALLHNTIEETDYSSEDIRDDFGDEISLLVDGVAKLDRFPLGDAAKAETIRKWIVSTTQDPRVLVIKLADRLHNMRTLDFLPRISQERIAQQTLDVYAPLARRLGINTIKWELEDLAFATLFPKRFSEINRLTGEYQPQHDELLRQVIEQMKPALKAAKILAEVAALPKHLYQLHQQMTEESRDFSNRYDQIGIRILVDTIRDCYASLGVIHANWHPARGRFRDYIAMPKFNMYQSLHTTVIGPAGKPVEIQIRTYAMHRTAEFGIAAHWKYREQRGPNSSGPAEHTDEPSRSQLLDWQHEVTHPSEFLDALRLDYSSQEVLVFTPKGDVISLPTGSTPVDFAYAIHTEVGHKCIGARVNGKLVPLESPLSNGDMTEIFTSKSTAAGPTHDWLVFARTRRARTKIRKFFSKERRDMAIEDGKKAIVTAMRSQDLPLQRMLTSENLMTIARDLRLPDVASLYAAVGEGTILAQSLAREFNDRFGGQDASVAELTEPTDVIPTRPLHHRGQKQDPGVTVKGVSEIWVRAARCCLPTPEHPVFGFLTRSGGVSVHREDCVNAPTLLAVPQRIVEAQWNPTPESTFLVAIQIEALDRRSLLADILHAIAGQMGRTVAGKATVTEGHTARLEFMFDVPNMEAFNAIATRIQELDAVYDVRRVHQPVL